MRTPIGEMVLADDGIIIHTIDEGATVDADAATSVLEATRSLAGGRPVAVVVDLRGVAFADRASRSMFASDPAGGVEVATALVAGPAISEFLASLFMRSEPERPTALFGDTDAARIWATEQLDARRDT